jgi:hypothetical protein
MAMSVRYVLETCLNLGLMVIWIGFKICKLG